MRIRLDRVLEVSLPNMTAEEVATSTQEVRGGRGQQGTCTSVVEGAVQG